MTIDIENLKTYLIELVKDDEVIYSDSPSYNKVDIESLKSNAKYEISRELSQTLFTWITITLNGKSREIREEVITFDGKHVTYRPDIVNDYLSSLNKN